MHRWPTGTIDRPALGRVVGVFVRIDAAMAIQGPPVAVVLDGCALPVGLAATVPRAVFRRFTAAFTACPFLTRFA